jgi:large subunit ribosomal protein L27e
MGKFLKPGKVVIMLAGRYAGRKAVILRVLEEGSSSRKFGHCIVAGIDQYPRKITRSMDEKKVAKRSTIKPFVKIVNFNHLMPTRYSLDVSEKLKQLVSDSTLTNEEAKSEALTTVKSILEDRYKNLATAKSEKAAQGVQFFFKKLRF